MASAYRTQRRVEFRDTDAAGIVHFSVFFTYMEQAEHELLRNLGLSVVLHDAEGEISWPRVGAHCDFLSAVKFEDVIDIDVEIARLGSKSVTYKFVFTCGGNPVASGHLTTVCCRFKPDQGRPRSIPIPEWILAKLESGGQFPVVMTRYLEQLTLNLATGMGRLPEAWRARHAAYLLAQQQPDGGFPGREGPSDLYYTSFALRSLALVGELDGQVAQQAARFLTGRLGGQVPIVDFLSLIFGAALLNLAAGLDVFAAAPAGWQQSVAGALEQLRRPDGGFAKTADGQTSSLYHSFLVVLCQQLLDLPTLEPQRLTDFVRSRRRDDGGFVEMEPMRRSGTNPTAAAIGLLNIFAAMDDAVRGQTANFLLDMQNDEGGWRANGRVPIADLLSTFTALVTLSDLNSTAEADLTEAQRFVELLQLPDGGFHGASWDGGCDVEYTFYGLGTSALLAELTEGEVNDE